MSASYSGDSFAQELNNLEVAMNENDYRIIIDIINELMKETKEVNY